MDKVSKSYDRITFSFLLFSGIVYVFFVVLVSYSNRLAADDYCFKADVVEHGFFQSLKIYYTTWQGRFGSHIIINTVVFFYDSFPSLFVYTVLLVGLYLYAIYRILKYLPIFSMPSRSLLLWAISFLLFNIFLLTVYDFSAFYWLNASMMYFGGIAFALFGISELLSSSKSVLSYGVLILSFVVAGSSAENFGLMLNLLLLFFLAYQTFYQKINTYTYQKTIVAFVFCFAAFLAMVLAEGNQVRRGAFPDTHFFYAIYRSIKYLYYTILALVAQRTIFLLVLSVAMIYVGALFRKESVIDEAWVGKFVAVATSLFLCFLVACIFPNVYAMGGIGAYRSLTHIAFYVVIFISIISFVIGYKTYFPKIVCRLLTFVGSFAFLIMANDMRINLHYTKQYIASEDTRIIELLKLKEAKTTGTVVLKPLFHTPYNIFISNEISSNGSYASKCISRAMRLGFSLRIEEKPKK